MGNSGPDGVQASDQPLVGEGGVTCLSLSLFPSLWGMMSWAHHDAYARQLALNRPVWLRSFDDQAILSDLEWTVVIQ